MKVITFIRSTMFNLLLALWMIVLACIYGPYCRLNPKKEVRQISRVWSTVIRYMLRIVCGIKVTVEGKEKLPATPYIIASKHQSALETILMHEIFDTPIFILKEELKKIPLFGYFVDRTGMIAINRNAGMSSLKRIIRAVQEKIAAGRNILIYPEGTRTKPGETIEYQAGIVALYQNDHINAPIVPVALNTGLIWPKNSYLKYPGTATIRILPPIKPGLGKEAFLETLKTTIEQESKKLLKPEKTIADPNKNV